VEGQPDLGHGVPRLLHHPDRRHVAQRCRLFRLLDHLLRALRVRPRLGSAGYAAHLRAGGGILRRGVVPVRQRPAVGRRDQQGPARLLPVAAAPGAAARARQPQPGERLGDVFFGLLTFFFAGQVTLDAFARYLLAILGSTVIFISFLVIVQSLAFWLGSVQTLGTFATNAIITFSIYPSRLFDASARLLLFTLVPAMLVGAVPAELVRGFTWERAGLLALGAVAFFLLAGFVFYRGLRRYESGSAIQIQS